MYDSYRMFHRLLVAKTPVLKLPEVCTAAVAAGCCAHALIAWSLLALHAFCCSPWPRSAPPPPLLHNPSLTPFVREIFATAAEFNQVNKVTTEEDVSHIRALSKVSVAPPPRRRTGAL